MLRLFPWLAGVIVHITLFFPTYRLLPQRWVTDLLKDDTSYMPLSFKTIMHFLILYLGVLVYLATYTQRFVQSAPSTKTSKHQKSCIFTLASCESRIEPGNGLPTVLAHKSANVLISYYASIDRFMFKFYTINHRDDRGHSEYL